MPVVNTTSSTACPGAAQASPSKRVPSSSSTYAVASPISEDQLLHGLELRRACVLEQLEQRRLDRAHDRPGALQALEAALVVDRVARADGVGRHVHLDPVGEQVVDRLANAPVSLDPAHDRLIAAAEVEALGAHGREHGLLDPRLIDEADLVRGVAEPLGGLLADERRQRQQARGRHELRGGLRHRGEGGVGAKPLLDVHHDQRCAVTCEQAHLTATALGARSRWTITPAASVSSTRPRSRRPAKQQFSERLSQPLSPATHSASRSTSARCAGPPGAISAGTSPNSSAPAVIRATSSSSSSSPVSTSPVWRAANAVSRPVVPIGACSKGTSFSSRACGAWSEATQSIVPARRPSTSASRSVAVASGGYIFMRVSIPRTSSSLSSRWWGVTSALTLKPRALARA